MLEQFQVSGRFLGAGSLVELAHFQREGAEQVMSMRLGHLRGYAAFIAGKVDEGGSPQAKAAHEFVRPAVDQILVACAEVVKQIQAKNLRAAASITPKVDEAIDYLERMLQAAP